MKITKIQKKTNEINPTVWRLNMTVGSLVSKRKSLQMDYHPFETCFLCDTKLEDDFDPNVAMVKNLGNRFFCNRCGKKIQTDKSDNPTCEPLKMGDDDIGLIKSGKDYDIWYEPITDIMNGFVVRNNDGNIIEIYTKEEQGM